MQKVLFKNYCEILKEDEVFLLVNEIVLSVLADIELGIDKEIDNETKSIITIDYYIQVDKAIKNDPNRYYIMKDVVNQDWKSFLIGKPKKIRELRRAEVLKLIYSLIINIFRLSAVINENSKSRYKKYMGRVSKNLQAKIEKELKFSKGKKVKKENEELYIKIEMKRKSLETKNGKLNLLPATRFVLKQKFGYIPEAEIRAFNEAYRKYRPKLLLEHPELI